MTVGKNSQTFCIIGAGPAGLTCALTMAQRGYLPMVFDKAARGKSRSRATGLQKETLGILDTLGVGNRIREAATPVIGTIIYDGEREIRKIPFIGPEDSPTDNLSLNQSITESILLGELEKLLPIHWGQDVSVQDNEIKILDDMDRPQIIVGADGRYSKIREAANINFSSELDSELSFGCDASLNDMARLDHDFMHQMQFPEGRLVFVPLPGKGNFKISGTFSKTTTRHPVPAAEELVSMIYERSGISVKELSDIFLYRLGTVRSENLGNKNIILIGDAAQTFFPNGGFGLNTAIQQGYSLGKILSCEDYKDPLSVYRESWEGEIQKRFAMMQSLRCR